MRLEPEVPPGTPGALRFAVQLASLRTAAFPFTGGSLTGVFDGGGAGSFSVIAPEERRGARANVCERQIPAKSAADRLLETRCYQVESVASWRPRWGDGRPRLGFIGLGIMGRPMARNLLAAGYELTAYNRTPEKAEELLALGAKPAQSPKEVAEQSDIVISIVTDSPDVEEVALGEAGVLRGIGVGGLYIDMSTISPSVARRVAEAFDAAGAAMLDAPVSGGDKGARERTLSIMVGGGEAAFAAALPVLRAMGRNVVHVGGPGMGQTVKLCNQVICGLNLLAAAEGLAFAARSGADLEKVLQVVTEGAAGSWILKNLGPKMIAGDYAPGFMVKLQQKDLRLALEEAADRFLPLPGTALVQQLFRVVQALGAADEGTQALIKAYERLGAIPVEGGASGA